MERRIARRDFLGTLAAVASGPTLLSLQTFPKPHRVSIEQSLRENLSDLKGTVFFDDGSRQAAADDFGHIVHRLPVAVLDPSAVQDVVKLVRLANQQEFKIAMNGNSHSVYGQAQVQSGVVIQSRGLKTIHQIEGDSAYVDAGVTWGELVKATLINGLVPPVLAEFQDLSIGGTLSVGGIGGTSHRFGAQVDTVSELEVVTGAGDLVTCSAERNRELFFATLAGLGQCTLILRARIRLVPAPTHVMIQNFVYTDLSVYLSDVARTALEEHFDHQLGRVAFEAKDRPSFRLEAGRFYSGTAKPDLAKGTAGLRFSSVSEPLVLTFWEYLNQRAAAARPGQVWRLAHATLYLFLPATKIETYLAGVLANPGEYAGAAGPMLFGVFPLNVRRFGCPLFQVPQGEQQFFAFYLFRTAPAGDAVSISSMVATNRSLFERARAMGGKQYVVSATPHTPADWKDHFGAKQWSQLGKAKNEFDPKNVLTPGPGIFGTP